ncbi:MAG: hypothetical protein EA397_08000 [Deltaproteobacteria bacterium]|nr:MAG: hypothetical protein EA397_08000 [Deltaproteobacteria bacterium]
MKPRPLVDLQTSDPPDLVLRRFRDCLAAGACPVEGHVGSKELSLALSGEGRHVFSPWLSVEVYPWRGGTRLRGVFGPHPNLWTLFVFIYATWVVVFIGGLVFGYGQWITSADPWGLWLAGGAAVAQGVSCGVDLWGRSYGRRQMQTIRDFMLSALPDACEVPPDAPLPWVEQEQPLGV